MLEYEAESFRIDTRNNLLGSRGKMYVERIERKYNAGGVTLAPGLLLSEDVTRKHTFS